MKLSLSDMILYARQSRQSLQDHFSKGIGDPLILEVLYLTYLEVEQVALGNDPNAIWDKWKEHQSPKGNTTFVPLSHTIPATEEGRKELIEQLDLFAKMFHFPKQPTFKSPSVKGNDDTPIEDLFI